MSGSKGPLFVLLLLPLDRLQDRFEPCFAVLNFHERPTRPETAHVLALFTIHHTLNRILGNTSHGTASVLKRCCLRAVNAIKSAFWGLACHLSLCRLLKSRFFVDSIPSALTNVGNDLDDLHCDLTPETQYLIHHLWFPGHSKPRNELL